MRDLDIKVNSIVAETQSLTTELFTKAKTWTKSERKAQIQLINESFKRGIEISNDKVSRAENIYELVDKQIRRLDSDLAEFKKALADKESRGNKRRKKSKTKIEGTEPKIPATAALALALTKNPNEVIDMPVDPNEPRAANSETELAELEQEKEDILEQIKSCRQQHSASVEPIDVDKDFARWCDLLHQYNECKDTCLVVFQRLNELRNCMTKDLYEEFGLQLDD
ncbi:Inhibitor of growth protein 5 [Cichlidogyrus casuarinus]|uniref:DNA repair protein SWI5 homolog n=1 Tax=Cichlidogyrus casuarinus TaxID=1844966 RepID=A0ABD2QIP8_9PLAT